MNRVPTSTYRLRKLISGFFLLASLVLCAGMQARGDDLRNDDYDPAWHPDPTSGDVSLFGGDLSDGNYAGGYIRIGTGQHHIPGRHFIEGDGWWVIACNAIGCNLSSTALKTANSRHPTYDGPDVPSQLLIWNALPYGLSVDRLPSDAQAEQQFRPRRSSDATLLAIFKPLRELSMLPLREGSLRTWWFAQKLTEEAKHPYAHNERPANEKIFDLDDTGQLIVAFDATQAEQTNLLVKFADHTQDLGPLELHLMSPKDVSIGDFVQWIGDLDGDGRPDLLINHSGYYWDTRLWLSSLAKNGELVGLAGRFTYSPPDSPGC